jgi:hypothetical protein
MILWFIARSGARFPINQSKPASLPGALLVKAAKGKLRSAQSREWGGRAAIGYRLSAVTPGQSSVRKGDAGRPALL